MFGKSTFLLTLLWLSTVAASQGGALQLENIVTQLIVEENSPLCLNMDFYELDQIFITQKHVDVVAVGLYQVYVHFTVVAACKSGSPQSCEDQMRLCDAQFTLNGTDIDDDICKCEALPDILFESGDDKIVEKSEKNSGRKNGEILVRKVEPDFKSVGGDKIVKKPEKNSRGKNGEPEIWVGKVDPHEALEDEHGDEAANPGRTSWKTKEEKRHERHLQDSQRGLITEDAADGSEDTSDRRRRKKKQGKPEKFEKQSEDKLNSIQLLLLIQDAVEAVNEASGNQFILSKIKSINLRSGEYTVIVVCDEPSGAQRCKITCKPQGKSKEKALLIDYVCKPDSYVSTKKNLPAKENFPAKENLPAKENFPAKETLPAKEKFPAKENLPEKEKFSAKSILSSTENNAAANTRANNISAPNKAPHKITLIAEYAAIQMDIIDADDYRRVVLEVTSVRETLTTDGNSLIYSLDVVMVSTSCTETKCLNDEDSGCLESLVSSPQLCNIDCSRSCMSNEPPTLVSSQCDPVPDSKWLK